MLPDNPNKVLWIVALAGMCSIFLVCFNAMKSALRFSW